MGEGRCLKHRAQDERGQDERGMLGLWAAHRKLAEQETGILAPVTASIPDVDSMSLFFVVPRVDRNSCVFFFPFVHSTTLQAGVLLVIGSRA